MTIQTPDTRGPWDQREAEAAAAGLAVAAILAAAGDGTATLAIHCWPAESGTQAHVYARVPADAARTLTDEHPLTRDESLLWPLWTGTVCGAPVTITTPHPAGPARSGQAPRGRVMVMVMVMVIGAARADADPAQRDRLKAEIPPLLEEYVHGGSPETVLRRVVEIMGPQWRPTGEWATWIDGLTKREAAE